MRSTQQSLLQTFDAEMMEGGTAPAAESSSSGNRILIVLVAVCAVVTVVAIVIAVVAVSRSSTTPNITIQGDQSTIGGSTSAGQGSSAGGRIFTLAVGHDWGAHSYIDTSGYLAGFFYDLVDAVCTEAGIDCRTVWDKYVNCWDTTPGQRSHGGQGLLGRWYDGCVGWYPTIDRVQVFSFSSPFIKPPNSYLFTKTGNAASFSSRNIANRKIGFIDGFAASEQCLARWTDVKGQDSMTIVHVNNPADIVAKLKSGEIEVAFASALDMADYASDANPEVEQVPGAGFSCMLSGNGVMTRKDNDFNSKWNVGLSKLISSGKFKRLCDAAVTKHGSRGHVPCVDG